MQRSELVDLIEKYDTEKYVFDVVGKRIRERGFLNFDEFYSIAMWKSPRKKNSYLQNTNEMVEYKTRASFESGDEKARIEKLCELNGVAIPTASAILTVTFPEKYGIIDIRCLSSLQSLNYDISSYKSTNTWLKYIDIVRNLAGEHDLTPREIDKALYAKSKIEQGDKNLYPY